MGQKARDKKLSPKDLQGANFTITSLGSIGGTAFTPLVNWPQVAILGISPATMQPVWNGEGFDPRLMLPLSLSYDHRVINGADAARFHQQADQAAERYPYFVDLIDLAFSPASFFSMKLEKYKEGTNRKPCFGRVFCC